MAINPITGKGGPSEINPGEGRSKPADKFRPKSAQDGGDRVSLSSSSGQFQRIRQLVDSVPDVRIAKIQELTRAIEAGSYNVDGTELADAIIEKNWIDFMA